MSVKSKDLQILFMSKMLWKEFKDLLSLPYRFWLMKKNLKAFLKSDRTHFPSDGNGIKLRIFR